MTDKTQTTRVGIPKAHLEGSERNLRGTGMSVSRVTATGESSSPEAEQLMEAVVERKNMTLALQRVERNKGAPGIDDMSVEHLRSYLHKHWPRVKEELLSGWYRPAPVRRVEIPKPGGKGVRQLGIPTVLDRLLQQALHQVLSPVFDSGFSDFSYGFRQGRSAQMAVQQARQYVASGKRWVVDLDLEKFFDQVNHDMLMARVARKVRDKRVLKLIRLYLQAGIMDHGLVTIPVKGTPQGGPLSPLLSNIVLDDLDREVEARGHPFCRYADDCNVYVQSRRAGERVLESITRFIEGKLKLRVNRDKSAVDRPWKRKFLGYSMTSHKQPRLKVAPASWQRLRQELKRRFRRGRGRNLQRFIAAELNPLLKGWMQYFQLSEVKGIFEEFDGWIRRRLRCILWRQWKRTYTRKQRLSSRGLADDRAWQSAQNGRGPWWNAGASHMNEAYPKQYFDRCGLVSLQHELRRLHAPT